MKSLPPPARSGSGLRLRRALLRLRTAIREQGLIFAGLCLIAAGLCTACGDDTENLYANTPAFFRFQPVTAAQPLYTALNSPGMFCTITFTSSHYVFTGPDLSTAAYPRTAAEEYGKPYYISGFIVGLPAIPDMQGNLACAAYDLACPNCDTYDQITRPLAFENGTTMSCPRCHRLYDLNSGGIVSSGDGGRSLYRYRIAYSVANNTLVIHN